MNKRNYYLQLGFMVVSSVFLACGGELHAQVSFKGPELKRSEHSAKGKSKKVKRGKRGKRQQQEANSGTVPNPVLRDGALDEADRDNLLEPVDANACERHFVRNNRLATTIALGKIREVTVQQDGCVISVYSPGCEGSPSFLTGRRVTPYSVNPQLELSANHYMCTTAREAMYRDQNVMVVVSEANEHRDPIVTEMKVYQSQLSAAAYRLVDSYR